MWRCTTDTKGSTENDKATIGGIVTVFLAPADADRPTAGMARGFVTGQGLVVMLGMVAQSRKIRNSRNQTPGPLPCRGESIKQTEDVPERQVRVKLDQLDQAAGSPILDEIS
jgi:hypothetical protein